MTINDRNILNEFANKLMPDLQKASKRFAPSIESKIDDTGLEITASEHIWTLVYGRKPTRKGVSAGSPSVRELLLDWINEKGITPQANDKGKVPTLLQLSYAMSRTIHVHGDSLFRSGKKRDIFGAIFAQYRFDELFSKLEQNYFKSVNDGIDFKQK